MGVDVTAETDEEKQIPVGIVVVCLLQIVVGGWAALAGFALFVAPVPIIPSLLGGLLAIVGSGLVVLAYGLWMFRSWGWGWTLIFHGLNVTIGIALLALTQSENLLAIGASTATILYVYAKHDLYLDESD